MLEISDIIMIIVDIRHPVIHFPPSLYHYVVKEMKRKLVVVFNKVHYGVHIQTIVLDDGPCTQLDPPWIFFLG